MIDIKPSVVTESLIETLERAAFVFTALSDGLVPAAREGVLVARGAFSYPFEFSLYIAAEDGVGREIAANMLGAEAGEVDAAGGGDAFGEVLNMLCGRISDHVCENEMVVFEVPQVSRAGRDELDALRRAALGRMVVQSDAGDWIECGWLGGKA